MQLFVKAFLALVLAHLITDFVLQSERLVQEKKRGQLAAYVEHGVVHYLIACLLAAFLHVSWLTSVVFQLVVLGLTAFHVLLDGGKLTLQRAEKIPEGTWTFLLDQVIHIAAVTGAAFLMCNPSRSDLSGWFIWLRSCEDKILLSLVVYTAVIFGGGQLVRHATKALLAGEPLIAGQTQEELRNAGLYIGWLERFLVLTALLLDSPAAVGLILTAKSVVRYPELKSVRFAEYFLIGTLLSISIAMLGGVALVKSFRVAASFGK